MTTPGNPFPSGSMAHDLWEFDHALREFARTAWRAFEAWATSKDRLG